MKWQGQSEALLPSALPTYLPFLSAKATLQEDESRLEFMPT